MGFAEGLIRCLTPRAVKKNKQYFLRPITAFPSFNKSWTRKSFQYDLLASSADVGNRGND